jgi:proteasome alpha subunit
MFEEPYRWVEAIRNRRDYLEEQLSAGSPIVGLSFENGILLATVGAGTAKLYEIYDQIAFGGIGHPADLEKLRNAMLDMAHIEGFNRSPIDVTVRRLMQFGLAPMIKQAFEEVLRAPHIVKILMAEISALSEKPLFFRLNYDGVVEEREKNLILAGVPEMTRRMEAFLGDLGDTDAFSFGEALRAALRTWAVSEYAAPSDDERNKESPPTIDQLDALLRKGIEGRQIEVALLDRTQPGSSKYRTASAQEIETSLKGWLQ